MTTAPFLQDKTLPIQLRVSRSSGRGPPPQPPILTSNRPLKYRHYSREAMVAAVEAVEHGKLSLRRAAEEYGIPKSTLQDRVSGKVGMDARSGRRLLSEYEEKKLVEFLIGCASVGYAKSRKEVLILVQHILSQHGKHTEVTKGWWDSFKGRHPEITLRNAEKLAYARASATNPTVIHCYFDLLEETLKVQWAFC
jgi:transposase-like protein